MTEDGFTIELTRDQALVLSDWLDRVMGTAEFDGLVNQDRAMWSPLYRNAGTLETSLLEVFVPGYSTGLVAARERLLDGLGEAGLPTDDDVGAPPHPTQRDGSALLESHDWSRTPAGSSRT